MASRAEAVRPQVRPLTQAPLLARRSLLQSRTTAQHKGFSLIPTLAPERSSLSAPSPTFTSRSSWPVPAIQKKLKVGSVNDPLEREADSVAEHVMRSPNPVSLRSATSAGKLQRKCSCGGSSGQSGECEECKREHQGMLQRAAMRNAAPSTVPAAIHDTLRSPGRPLDSQTRAFFEPRFNWDFSQVRVHADQESAASAEAVGARAYTVGQHIAFASGQFAPHLSAGQRLLAHELTHVIQQSSPRWQGARLPDGVEDERHADSVAANVAAGRSNAGLLPSGSVANAGTGLGESRTIQRAPALLPPEKVQEVYEAWFLEFSKGGQNTVLTKEVLEKVKNQVGPGNFANWERWKRAQQASEEAQSAAGNAPAKPLDPQAQMQARRDRMWEATNQLRAEIVRIEYLAQKLNFGRGVKGAAARSTAAAYTKVYGVGARTIGSVTEHAPMLAVGAAGLVAGSELAERTLVKQGRAVKQEAEEMGEDIRTAERLESGELQAAYEATRPSYRKYMKAYSDFTDASVKFNKDLGLEGVNGFAAQAKDISDMEAAIKAMREAGNEYLMATAKMGIETDAKALDKMAAHIMKGSEEVVSTAVMFGLPEVAPGLGEMRGAFKGGAGMTARQVEKAAVREVAAIGKTGEKAAAEDVGKSALKETEEAAAKPGSAPGAGEAGAGEAAAAEAKTLKSPPAEEAQQIKQLAKDKDAVKRVSDPAFSKEYDLEIEVNAGGEKHTYRRKQSDGTWCRFSKRDCGYQFNREDQEAINRMAAGEFATAAGSAVENYVTSLGYSKPREGNFPGIDGWKGGNTIPKGTRGSTVERVVDADVVQIKAMNSLKHSDIIDQYNKGITGLLEDSWATKNLVVSKPKSRTLLMVFDEATYSRLSFGQEMELKKLIKTMTDIATKGGEPIVVKWVQFIGGKLRPL